MTATTTLGLLHFITQACGALIFSKYHCSGYIGSLGRTENRMSLAAAKTLPEPTTKKSATNAVQSASRCLCKIAIVLSIITYKIKTSNVSVPHFSHEKRFVCSLPLYVNSVRTVSSANTFSIAAAKASVLSGSTSTAAFPATSGRDAALEQITGVPQAKASKTGKP